MHRSYRIDIGRRAWRTQAERLVEVCLHPLQVLIHLLCELRDLPGELLADLQAVRALRVLDTTKSDR